MKPLQDVVRFMERYPDLAWALWFCNAYMSYARQMIEALSKAFSGG